MASRHRKWIGKVPAHDCTGSKIIDTFIDGRTTDGWWALMTPETHEIMGCGLGVGRGQKYRWQSGKDFGWYRVDEKEGA